jgi:hypothetical protein
MCSSFRHTFPYYQESDEVLWQRSTVTARKSKTRDKAAAAVMVTRGLDEICQGAKTRTCVHERVS